MASHDGTNEIELIIQAKSGDHAAYDQLVRLYQGLAFCTAWVILRHEQDARDATQQAFVNAWSALPSFKVEQPFRPWLLRKVSREAKSRHDSRHRWYHLTNRFDEHFNRRNSAPELEHLSVNRGPYRHLTEAISNLPDMQQRVILLKYAMGFSEQEITTILDVRTGAVGRQLDEIVKQLEGMVGDNLGGAEGPSITEQLDQLPEVFAFPSTPRIYHRVSERIDSRDWAGWLPFALLVLAAALVVLSTPQIRNGIWGVLSAVGF